MNVQDYRTAGYSLSLHIDQAAVTRAENDVRDAYLTPIVGATLAYNDTDETIKRATMALAYTLVQLRMVVATRVGGKVKMTEQSNTPTRADIINQNARTCHLLIEQCRALDGADATAEVTDICGIYFKTNYFYMKG